MKKLVLLISILFASNIYADAISETCKKDKKVCSCAVERFKKGLEEEEYSFFLSVSEDFLSIKSEGIGTEDSWDMATKDASGADGLEVATARVNKLKDKYRATIKACSK